jgi:uracil-DNA glycosylase
MCSPDFRVGNIFRHIVFMASCPGENEEREGRPLSPNGVTGQSAREFVERLHFRDPQQFASSEIDDYTQLNSHPTPRWSGRPGQVGTRTHPTSSEILTQENLDYLRHRLQSVQCHKVLLLGLPANTAWCAIAQDFPNVTAYRGLPHPQNPNAPRLGTRILNWDHWATHVLGAHNGAN